jgi:hypothetical protein
MREMASEERGNWLRFFASVAPAFQSRFVEPLWSRYPHTEREPWQSLGVFLEGYAFEHQGRDPSFGHAAGQLMEELQSEPLAGVAASEVWKRFRKKFPNKSRSAGFNPKINPLAPKGEPYERSKTKKPSVIEFVQKKIESEPLAAWAKGGLPKETEKIHGMLCGINGVGPKIASLFLRDVAVLFRLAPT